MSRRTHILLSAVIASMFAVSARADQTTAHRASAFAALPNWTGLWETEAASTLLITGNFVPPKLSAKPPYKAEWEKKSDHGPHGGPAITPFNLPSTSKVCQLQGFPGVMDSPVPDYYFELLVTPEQTLLLSTDGAARHIYTDGRRHPAPDDLWPTEMGDSIGHWEARTLVIDTIARKAGPVTALPGGAELSVRARFTERLWLVDANTMQDDMTIDDPTRFAHPWQITIRYKRVADANRMIAVNCTENDRNPLVNGKYVIAPP